MIGDLDEISAINFKVFLLILTLFLEKVESLDSCWSISTFVNQVDRAYLKPIPITKVIIRPCGENMYVL